MPPGAGGKRKRGDRTWAGDSGNDGQRPSPHRPGNLSLAHQNHYPGQHREWGESRGRGGRRPNRNGRVPSGRIPSDAHDFSSASRDPATSPPSATPSKEASDLIQANGEPSIVNPPPSSSPRLSVVISSTVSSPLYAYEYVTRDDIEAWASTGKRKVVEIGVTARSGEDIVALTSLFQEILRSILDGKLQPMDGGIAIKEIVGDEAVSEEADKNGGVRPPNAPLDPRSLFLDTLSILTDSDTSNTALQPFIFSTGISPALLRLELESPLLNALGLVRDTFSRMGIRKQTNLLYRQSNYNLLREESEGYSKLLTELFTTSNNEPPSSEVVEDTFERVKAMIGTFDLDVGRVLDVMLDVFAAVLVKQYRFFVKFLRVSSWWPQAHVLHGPESDRLYSGLPKWASPGSAGWLTTDEEREENIRINGKRDRVFWDRVREVGTRAFSEIGRLPITEDGRQLPVGVNDYTEDDETRKWIKETGTLPPQGNRVAAQLLGFKLRFYSSPVRDETDVLPDNLIYLAALLIKIGFISLHDLYPHLWRPDESMEVLKEEKMKEKAERDKAARPGGGMNALMMAGALSDDTLPTPRPRDSEPRSGTPAKDQGAEKTPAVKVEEKEQLPEPSDQKVLLLKSLLAIGAVPESLFILSRFPWLMDAYPELPEFIHRVLHHCLSRVYAPLRPLSSLDQMRESKHIPGPDQSGVPKGQIKLIEAPPRRVLRWAQLDKEDTNDGTDYRFYWDDWADNIPICQSVDDVFALCSSFLNISNYKIGQDPGLLTKLARIGKDNLSEDASDANKSRWKDLCKRLILPSLSLTKANPGVVNEVFDLVSTFPREVRYNMYAEWYFGQTSRQPDIKAAFDLARAETKDTLKRLSKTNLRPMARALAKIAYANPGIVINVAISQIESYENLIEVVVECARYFTFLGYDILTWSLINSLGQKGRSRVQEGGLLTSRWLNALATFAGRAFKRYAVMNPTPVLQYVVEQLQRNNSTDLIVLEQMISSMAGIVTDTNFNDAQIQAMAGGELLQAQTMLQLLDKRHESKTTSRRLMKSLTDSKLAGQLLIAIAQERVTCIFKESEADPELKLLGNIFDEIHRVLTQYLDLLRSNFSVAEFDSFVPGLAALISNFGIQPEIAFWISRPSLSERVADANQATRGEPAVAKKLGTETLFPTKILDDDTDMIDDGETTEKEEETSAEEHGMDIDKEVDAGIADAVGHPVPSMANPTNVEPAPLHPVIQDLVDEVKCVLPLDIWEVVGLPFYVTFWQLSLYDLHIPQKAYEDEIERQKRKVYAIGNDRSDVSVAGTQRKEREKKQITELQERLLEENKRHLKSYGQARARLQKEKDRWFAGMRGKHDALNVAIMEQCLLPRLLLSPIDAFYCFKMLKYLHSSGTPNFRTIGLLDQLFRDQRLTALIFQSTSKEADNLGRFLNEVLRDLSRWHADKAVYDKEAFGTRRDLPGFAMAVDPDGKPSTFLDYEDFRRLLYKWHRLLASALKTCLNGGEYMHIRNAISVLKAVVESFPAVNWIGRDMLSCVNALSQNDERDDVKTPAASLIGDLNRREKKWMLPQAFMINESTGTDKGKSRTPRPQSTTPVPLNATVPEFKPAHSATVNGAASPRLVGKPEVEDGEIQDAKMTDAEIQPAIQPEQPPTKLNEGLHAQPDPQQQKVPAATEAAAIHTDIASEEDTRPGTPIPNEPPTQSIESDKAPEPTPMDQAENQFAAQGQSPHSPSQSRPSSRPPEASRSTNIPPRPEPNRLLTSSHPGRPQANLPNRPETHRLYRPGDARMRSDLLDDRRDRHTEFSRQNRYGDHYRERSFESAGDVRAHPRRDDRLPDRERVDITRDRDFLTRAASDEHFRNTSHRDSRPALRDAEWAGRPALPSQADAYQARSDSERLPRDIPPSRPIPQSHLDRADPLRDHSDRMVQVELESPRRSEQSRLERDERRPHSSRASSPLRTDDPRSNRADRFLADDRRSGIYSQANPNRHDDYPTGPRGDRLGRAPPSDLIEPRELWSDMSHGRLNQESRLSRQQESSDIPSGPRARNPPGRGRNASTSQSTPGTPPSGPTTIPDRLPPTGPSSRLNMRSGHDQPGPSAGPPSPVVERPDNGGLFYERTKGPQASSDSSFGGVRSHQNVSSSTPSGPRGVGHNASSGLSSLTRGLPSGPGFGNEHSRGDKRITAINHVLQQSRGPMDRSGQEAAIRGRGNSRQVGDRQVGAINAPSPQGSQPATPTGSSEHGNDLNLLPERPDLFPGQIGGSAYTDDDCRALLRVTTGRRPDIMEDTVPGIRRSNRHTPNIGNTTNRDHEKERDRDRDRDKDRERDRRGEEDNNVRSVRRDDHRERQRDYDRDRNRRGDNNISGGRDEPLEVREPFGRRNPGNRDGDRRRDRRDREESAIERTGAVTYENQGRLRAPPLDSSLPLPQFPLSALGGSNDERRWGGGRGENRDRDRDRNRDRERDRDREYRDGSGNLPRKRDRLGDDNLGHGDGGRGGMRVNNESKRPRRGGG